MKLCSLSLIFLLLITGCIKNDTPGQPGDLTLSDDGKYGYQSRKGECNTPDFHQECFMLYGARAEDGWREFLIDTKSHPYDDAALADFTCHFKADTLQCEKSQVLFEPGPLVTATLIFNYTSGNLTKIIPYASPYPERLPNGSKAAVKSIQIF